MERCGNWIDRAYIALAFVVPFSIKLYFPAIDLEIITPAEAIIGALALSIMAGLCMAGWRGAFDASRLRHPLVLAVLAGLFVQFAASLASPMPLVSWKATAVRTSYVVVFFLFPLLRKREDGVSLPWRVLGWHAWVLVAVVLFTWFRQTDLGFDRNGAAFAAFPFYNDHNIYAAAITFAAFRALAGAMQVGHRSWHLAASPILFAGALLSFSRGAWLALLPAIGMLLLIHLRVRPRTLLLVLLPLCLTTALAWPWIRQNLMTSTVDANARGSGARETLYSLTNVTTDASNLERMNRWSCAWRIFKDHPVLGCGPGTFQFTYVPYQRPEESTYLSLTGPVDAEMISSAWKYKDLMYVRSNPQMFYLSLGTAHSEYLLALSEGGLLAGLMLFAILALVVWIGLRRTADASNWWAEPRTWAAVSLVAYFVHGAFNNYLDDCKVAMPFWLTLAMLAAPLEKITARPVR